MIFASVGSMLPFDRLVRAVDTWAAAHPETGMFIQIGGGDYIPRHAAWARMIPHDEYQARLAECRLFVAHVGMGSILQALEAGRQMLLMPRHPEQGEHTTDHQRHTAARFAATPGLRIVDDSHSLGEEISAMLERPVTPDGTLSPHASPALLDRVSAFLGERGAS